MGSNRFMLYVARLLQLRHIGDKMFPEDGQLGILLEIPFDIVQNTRNIGEELGIAFDAINIDESARRFEVTLDAREVEQTAEGFPVSPHLPMRSQPVEIAVDQAINQYFVEFDIGITQERGKIIRRRPHQRILKVYDPQSISIDHQIARMIVPMNKDSPLAG